MIIKSYAKINLSLKITGKREDGYHLLEMVNLPLALHDVIEFEPIQPYQNTHIICDDPALAIMKHNLCMQAYQLMQEKYKFKQHYLIRIHKEIPFAAGLGGGSSNAAAVLLALNKMLHLGASQEELSELGLQIGADVPFFLQNKPMLVTGIGDVMSPIPMKNNCHVLLVKPEKGLSTKDVYSVCDNFPRARIDTQGVIQGLQQDDGSLLAKSIGNDLMAAAESLLPEVGEVYGLLRKKGFTVASMSGSGSCLFALTHDESLCRDAAKAFEKAGYDVRTTTLLL